MSQVNKKVLIIDDDELWIDLLREAISRYYNFIDEARSREEVYDKIGCNRKGYDLVIADLRLKEDAINNHEGLDIVEKMIINNLVKRSIIITCHPDQESKNKADDLNIPYLIKGPHFYDSLNSILINFMENEEKPTSSTEENVNKLFLNNIQYIPGI
jgi:ActR/RegA family two-component response regulator